MADDRLDDAIDAVVRAVDRIERATRRAAIDDEHPDVRAPATGVAPGREAWEPSAGGKKKSKGKKHREREAAFAAASETVARIKDEAGEPSASAPSPTPTAAPFAPLPHDAPPEVHELVGRIVARTQELDDHLDAVQKLRSELNELVARLGAAATHPR